MKKRLLSTSALGALALAASIGGACADEHYGVRHVLLISIDGMHAVDFKNCVNDATGANGGESYCPNLAALQATGVNYLDASTSKPSDSFPGLMSIVSGSTPRRMGVYYDVAYDRFLAPPAVTTGNGLAGGQCAPGVANGTTTEYEEGVDYDQTKLNGGAPNGADGGIASINPKRLIRDPANNCAPVYPWNFVRANTIFGVIHQAGGYTAWSDKHPAYSSVSGPVAPGQRPNLDDYYSPEINSIPDPTAFNGVILPDGTSCAGLPDKHALTASDDYTTSFQNIQCYDMLKVNAILNEINGKTHDGRHKAPAPTIFGMNFQSVSVGEKLIQKSLNYLKGGYLDNQGKPSPVLLNEIQFVDGSIGEMVKALKKSGDYDSTLIVITAKHGQSPVDSSRYLGIGHPSNSPITTSPATILDAAGCLPASESPSSGGIGPTEDDVSLIWLNGSCATPDAVGLLQTQSPATANAAGIGEIYSGSALDIMFGAPGLAPDGDPRTPDIVVTPDIGVTYSGSAKKQAEHGGFAHDDTNVMLLLANPRLPAVTVTSPVETAQIAPTILKVLGLDADSLDSVKQEGTQTLPSFLSK